jgi:hypothetical protein
MNYGDEKEKPRLGEYKGHQMLYLPLGIHEKTGNVEEFGFGLRKAKAILEYIDDIRDFVLGAKEG